MNRLILRIIALFAGAALPLAVAWPQEPPKAPVLVSVEAAPIQGNWQLPTTHFVRAKMPMTLVHPRPDSETNSWARHRKAYPGLEYRIPVALQGGAYPFHYEILEGPEGMKIGRTAWNTDYGVLSWTPDSSLNGQEFPVAIRVYGQEYERETAETVGPTFVDVEFVVRVTDSTADFIFVDGSVERSGDGSISSPLKTLKETYGDGDDKVVTYPGRAVYIRTGVYETLTDDWFGNKGYAHVNSERTPAVFLGYPGEAVEVDAANGILYGEFGGHDLYFGGIVFRNTSQRTRNYHGTGTYTPIGSRTITPGGWRNTFFENEFHTARMQFLDYSQVFNFEQISDSQFKVPGIDATAAFSANSYHRVYSDSRNYSSVRIQNSSYDGADTYVTVNLNNGEPPVLPSTITTVKRQYTGGNEGFITTNRTKLNKPYFTAWGNHFDDWHVGVDGQRGGHALGSLYSHKYLVVEQNSFGYGEGSSALYLKQSIDFASVRRNIAVNSMPTESAYGFTGSQLAPGETVTKVHVEFCYNKGKITPDSKSALRVFSSAGGVGTVDDPSKAWIYRNTFVGKVESHYWYDNAAIEAENNILITGDSSSPFGDNPVLILSGNVVQPRADETAFIDENFNLIGSARDQYHGTHGAEITPPQ